MLLFYLLGYLRVAVAVGSSLWKDFEISVRHEFCHLPHTKRVQVETDIPFNLSNDIYRSACLL
jgi:hypothetical protein